MNWRLTRDSDRQALPLVDRHYSRGKPGTNQFVGPYKHIVLVTDAVDAVWVTVWPRYTLNPWMATWHCSVFRNEGPVLSSLLITEAIAVTRSLWGEPPELGMTTFVDAAKVQSRNPGWCFKVIGFRRVGRTKINGLDILQLLPSEMPEASLPNGAQFAMEMGA